MRKIIGLFLAIFVLSLAAVYVFIPSQISIKGSQIVYQPSTSVIRGMMQTAKWSEWMPKDITLKATSSLVATIQADLNQDGKADIIAGTQTQSAQVKAFSAIDLSVIDDFFAFQGGVGVWVAGK